MRWNKLEDEACSVARTVSVIGDRWTLLILRDCFLRVRRFEEFQARLGVTRPILASRLRKLVKDFVLAKVPYQERPLRYEYRLTQKGVDLWPVLYTLMTFGEKYYPLDGPMVRVEHRTCGTRIDDHMCCPKCGVQVEARDVVAHWPEGVPSAAWSDQRSNASPAGVLS